jgi:AcrR family transcriptional regulator
MSRSRRSDARHNRAAILRVAESAFALDPQVVPLHEIARRAGLARATVYRHFPDRHALAAAVAAARLGALRRAVSAAERDDRSFRDLLEWVLSMQAALRPLVAVVHELPIQEQRRLATELIGILTPPFERAKRDGLLREELMPSDLSLVLTMLNAAADAPTLDAHHDLALRRIINLVLDGLFYSHAVPVDDVRRRVTDGGLGSRRARLTETVGVPAREGSPSRPRPPKRERSR